MLRMMKITRNKIKIVFWLFLYSCIIQDQLASLFLLHKDIMWWWILIYKTSGNVGMWCLILIFKTSGNEEDKIRRYKSLYEFYHYKMINVMYISLTLVILPINMFLSPRKKLNELRFQMKVKIKFHDIFANEGK